MSSISTHRDKKRVHLQLPALFSNSRFHTQIWQFWKRAISLKTAARRVKISLNLTRWGRKGIHMQLWDLSSKLRFHAQIWQFWKSAHISETAFCRAKISSTLTSWGRKSVYVQLLELLRSFMAKYSNFEIRIWKSKIFVKTETAVRRAKVSLISTQWGRKRVHICNFRTFFQIPDFMPKYVNLENQPDLESGSP